MEDSPSLITRLLRTFARQEGLDDLLAMSEHPNGYKRENAVRRLGVLGNPLAIPKLLVRANDWVPQVRSAAKDALRRLLKRENTQAFIDCLPQIHHLERCGRSDHRELIASVTQFLLLPENVDNVRSAITSDNPYIARTAVRMCIDHALIDKPLIVSQCLSRPDVVVRDMGAGLLRDLNHDALEPMLQKAIRDPFMPVRREAFQLYLSRLPDTGLRLAHEMLFDRHIAIREIALNRLVRHGIDVEKIFAVVLSSPDQKILKLRAALAGIATLRAKSQMPLLRNFTAHNLPSLREASLQAMTKLDEEEARPLLIAGLRDASPSVAKESASLLSKGRVRPTLLDLMGAVNDARFSHTIDVCITGSRVLNKWDRLIFLLNAFPRLLDEKNLTDRAGSELSRWDCEFNRSASQPTNEQKLQVAKLYERYSQLLSESRRKSLEFTIRGFGIAV